MAAPGSTYRPARGKTPTGSPATETNPQNKQTTTNYTIPSVSLLTDEACKKVASNGSGSSFKAITSDVDVKEMNGRVVATVPGNSKGKPAVVPVADLGAAPGNTTPASALNGYQPHDDNTAAYKVKLRSEIDGVSITFDVMPEIGESLSASYDEFNPIQHPGGILKYKGTNAREWSINVHFASRTASEATENLKKINILRSWMMPYHGQGTADDPQMAQFLGAPPPVLTLSGYGPRMIGPLKVVLLSYQWNWPIDVDYIQTLGSKPVPFPVLMTVQLSLKEAWSPKEFSSFDLKAFRRGELPKAYQSKSASPQASKTAASATNGSSAGIDSSQPAAATPEQCAAASGSANTIAAGNTTQNEQWLAQIGGKSLSDMLKAPVSPPPGFGVLK